MKTSIRILACILAIGVSGSAVAEIYETKDAEGNTVFTDTPTAAADEVELPKTNIADPVKETPQAAPQAATKAATKAQQEQGEVVVIHDNRNERLERELAEQRPHEELEAEKRHEVGEAEAIREVGDVEGVKQGTHVKKVEGAHPAAHPHVGHHR